MIFRCAILLFALTAANVPAADAPPPNGSPASDPPTLEQIDAALSAFKSRIWTAPQELRYPQPDNTGATLAQDLADNVLTDAVLARVEATRAAAAASVASPSDILPEGIAAAFNNLLQPESCRAWRIMSYWDFREISSYHEDLLQRLADRLEPSDKQQLITRMQSISGGLGEQRMLMLRDLEQCADAVIRDFNRDSLHKSFRMLDDYNQLRQEMAAGVPAGNAVMRTAACPTPQKPAPRRRVVFVPDVAKLYPDESRTYRVEGTVKVSVQFNGGGCVTSASIAQSSGADLLDQAGIEVGLGLIFQPQEVDGQGTGEVVVLPLKFSLD